MKICDVVLHDRETTPDWFRRYFFAGLLNMGQDKVSNVRLSFITTVCDNTVPGVTIAR